MLDKKELNQEDLKKVSGGKLFNGDIGKYENEYNIPVDKYQGVKGKRYLFRKTNSETDWWLFGILSNTYEKDYGAFTKLTHDVYVEDGYGVDANPWSRTNIPVGYYGTMEIYGDNYQMYRSNKE